VVVVPCGEPRADDAGEHQYEQGEQPGPKASVRRRLFERRARRRFGCRRE
jgi:hypothetical protein